MLGEPGHRLSMCCFALHWEKKVIKRRRWSEGSWIRRGPAPDSGVFKRPLPLCPKQRQEEAARQLPEVYLGDHPLAGHKRANWPFSEEMRLKAMDPPGAPE